MYSYLYPENITPRSKYNSQLGGGGGDQKVPKFQKFHGPYTGHFIDHSRPLIRHLHIYSVNMTFNRV